MSKEALQEIILNRRSIRGFQKDSVELATIKRIIQIGRSAPSGANLQPGRFTVLTNKPLQDLISVLQEAIDNDTPVRQNTPTFQLHSLTTYSNANVRLALDCMKH